MPTLERMTGNAEDFEFAFAVKRDAIGPHVRARWEWDDEAQRRLMREKWNAKTCYRIFDEGTAVGMIAIDQRPGEIHVSEFYISPAMHGRGIGSAVLRQVFERAEGSALPVRLRCLKWNPAYRLYRRQGFIVTSESDIHFYMERPAMRSITT